MTANRVPPAVNPAGMIIAEEGADFSFIYSSSVALPPSGSRFPLRHDLHESLGECSLAGWRARPDLDRGRALGQAAGR